MVPIHRRSMEESAAELMEGRSSRNSKVHMHRHLLLGAALPRTSSMRARKSRDSTAIICDPGLHGSSSLFSSSEEMLTRAATANRGHICTHTQIHMQVCINMQITLDIQTHWRLPHGYVYVSMAFVCWYWWWLPRNPNDGPEPRVTDQPGFGFEG